MAQDEKVSLVDKIYHNLQQSNMTMQEMRKATGVNINTLRTNVGLMIRLGLVTRDGLKYSLTPAGEERMKAAEQSRMEEMLKKRITDQDILNIVPDRKVFSTRAILGPLAEMKGRPINKRDLSKHLKKLCDDRQIIRVSDPNQPNAKLTLYIKGMEKDEWVCSKCKDVKSANEFDAENWGIAGAVCNSCRVVPKPEKIPVSAIHRAGKPTNGKLVAALEQNSVTLENLAAKMEELVKLSAKTYELFSKLATK